MLDAARAAVADDADFLYEVAHLYERVGQKSMTEQVLRDVLTLDPAHASAANDLGYTLGEDGRELERAESLTRKAVEADPSNPSFLDSLGWVLYKRGRFEEARQALARAVELSHCAWRRARPGGARPPRRRALPRRGRCRCRGALEAGAGPPRGDGRPGG